jgi:magnesium transporter
MALARYDPQQKALVPTDVPPDRGWFHVEHPTPTERAIIAQRLGVAEAFLDHALDVDEIARLDRLGDARLVVLRIPCKTGGGHAPPFRGVALGVLLTGSCVVTVCRKSAAVVDSLAARGDLDIDRHERFVLQLLLCVAEQFIASVEKVNEAVEALEEQLQASLRNQEVYELLRFQKSLVHFKTALDADRLLVDRLQTDSSFPFQSDDADLFADLLVELGQASEMATISSNILSEMMDAFASLISNNLNVVMKVLTLLTILVAIPNLVASVYGMNVGLPGQHRPDAFALIVVGSLLAAGGVGMIFRRKGWL